EKKKADGGKHSEEAVNKRILDALREHFKPEFLNRIDEIIVFHPLKENQIRSIVDLQLAHVMKRLEKQKIKLTISDKAKDWLAKKGYDENLGARPLKRVIQTELLDKLAMKIIEKTVGEGDTVAIEVTKEGLKIGK
ncbi:MAG TPA: AAA family ATPase, partial [Candidatus Magasanikbacteria bacterium]|nr:AAA family ATPase [Candidatus Magasanikbacteria bacterium]